MSYVWHSSERIEDEDEIVVICKLIKTISARRKPMRSFYGAPDGKSLLFQHWAVDLSVVEAAGVERQWLMDFFHVGQRWLIS